MGRGASTGAAEAWSCVAGRRRRSRKVEQPITHVPSLSAGTDSAGIHHPGPTAARLLAVPVVEFYGLCEAGMMTAPAVAASVL